MASVTQTNNEYAIYGHRNIVTATFTSPADTNTWDTGLRSISHAAVTIVEASGDAADAISVASISGGIVTLDGQGTVAY
mgnify:FL=1